MFVTLATTCLLVLLSVGVHYNVLTWLTNLLAFLCRRDAHVRRWVAVSILGVLVAHIVEVQLFAVGYYVLDRYEIYGRLAGNVSDDLTHFSYYSFVAYTSLGFGDIIPSGWLRLMTAIETLLGLILIAWSASFLFMQMQRFWNIDAPSD